MRRHLFSISMGLMALALAGCCGNNPMAVAAKPNTCGQPSYRAPNCAQTRETISGALDHLNTVAFNCDQPVALALPSEHCSPADLPKDAKPGEVWCCVKVQPPAAAPRQVCVCEEQCIDIPVAAVYKTVSKQVLVSTERVEWQRTDCQHVGETDCWKLVVIPAVYQTVNEEQLVTPPSVRREVIPAKFALQASPPPPAYWEWRRVPNCESTPNGSFKLKTLEGCEDNTCPVPPAGPAISPK